MKKSITEFFNKWGGVQKTNSLLIFLFTLIFASCSNLFTSQESLPSNTKIHFTGTLCITGALPASLNETCHAELDSASQSSSSRSALPSITPGLDYYYYVTATQTDGSGTFNINSIDNSGSFNTSSDVTFALELTTGKWDIECGIKKAASSGVVSGNDVTVMSDTYPAPLTSANPVLNHTFYPKPSQSGSGSLELTFTYDNGTVDSVIVKCGSDEWTCSSSSTTQWTVSEDSIDSGTYDVNIYFYKNDESEKPILVYSTTQTINIFDDMTTNTWVSDGSGAINDSGEFNLTNNLISQFSRTTFYVGDTGVGKEPSDTEGTGSPYAPFETINKAIEIIEANGDSTKDYRIFVSGTVPGAQTIYALAKSLTIQGLNELDENGNPKDTIDGSLEGSPNTDTLYLLAQYPVFIKNLTITGNSEKNGIYYQTYSNDKKTLTLESGTYITGNKNGAKILNAKVVIKSGALISQNMRGVYASTGGELVIKEGAVITLNKGEANGAGIFVESGSSLEVQGGEISYNEASGNGGGINSSYCSFTMTGGLVKGNKARSGGGIYTRNTGNSISGGTITENEATVEGGGIYADYNLLLTGVEISLNKSALAGAVAAYRNALTLGENVYIPWGAKNENGTLVKAAGMNDLGIVDGGGVPSEYIIIGADLSKHSKEDPIALTRYEWQRGKTIVQAGTNVTDLTPYKNYFTYTQDGWGSKVSTDKKSIYIDTPIYVAGQTNHPYCGVAGNDTNGDGTKAKPYATIAKAIELLTDKDTDYTIYIDGTISGVQTIPDTLKSDETGTYKAKSLTIDGVNGLDDTSGEPIDILDGNKASDSTLTVDSNVPVTITNLKIINGTGKSSFKRGGGIYISSNASLALGDGALVTQNTAKDGGGIYNLGKLFLYGTAMVGMQTNSVATSDNWGNKATAEGAGIYSYARGQIYLGYRNESETEELTGGVCGNYNANTTPEELQEGGGGICMSSNFESGKIEIDSGNISYNYAVIGAGIYTRGHVTMTGGTIEGNEGNSADTTNGKGGGIYLYDFNGTARTFTMSGNAVIKNNKNTFGAGVYLPNGYCTFEMNGGEISGNIALSNGGAVYMDNLEGSSFLNIQGSANIPYGGAVKNNDIYMSDTSQKIKITAPLSDREADKVIGLTPSSYTERTLLEAGTGVTLADEVGKFTVTNNEWGILATGYLVKAKTATTLAETLSALSANTVDNPYDILLYASSESDFATIKSILQNNSSKYVNITLYCPGFTSLPESAFISCKSLVGITLPYGITDIGQFVFAGCSNLSSLILPESLKSTSYRDLNGCTALKSIVLPESLETIGSQSFDSTGLTSITIPKNVKTISNDAFASSSSLAEVIVDSENQYFKAIDGVLYNKEGTKLLYYPAAKTGSFVIPNSVTQIGGYSFYHSQLSYLTIPESVTSIGDRAFEACSLTSITLPNSLRTIESEAFALCSNLTTVMIPKNVTSIYRSPFSGCPNLTEIIVEEGNSKYVSVNGVLFDKDKTLLICYPAGSSATSYTIPNTVEKIGTYAFNRCSKLTSITISDSVNYINSYGIYSCTSLTSIIFTDTTTWYKTSKYTFTDGEVVDFTDSAANASTINNSQNTYWYKMQEEQTYRRPASGVTLIPEKLFTLCFLYDFSVS